FGRDAYGIQAASQAYFDEDAEKLTVPQAAVLASVLNNPSAFDPAEGASNPDRLLGRYRYVLQSMSETGAISPGDRRTGACVRHDRLRAPAPACCGAGSGPDARRSCRSHRPPR
ncbi:hypothetical protein B4Q13_17780, partial [Lacticaseibacillus rhamnosus]